MDIVASYLFKWALVPYLQHFEKSSYWFSKSGDIISNFFVCVLAFK